MGRATGRPRDFAYSAMLNQYTYMEYLDFITNLALSRFTWTGFPDTINLRFLEMQLFRQGYIIYFEDEVIGALALNGTITAPYDVYGEPLVRRVRAINGYQRELTNKDSVIIYDNMLHQPTERMCTMYALRLYNYDRIIDVNSNAQKTPILIKCDEEQRLTILNLYKQYDGNTPVIFGDSSLDIKTLEVLKTDAPYICDKIWQLKQDTWSECLTRLGIPNVSTNKKERLITEEVTSLQGGAAAARLSYTNERQWAADAINKMFNKSVSVDYTLDVSKFAGTNNEEAKESGGQNE